jgi:hypothetical protein
MIPIETLKQVTHIYCHGHCPDGLASAMILKDAFRMLGMSPRIEFLTHGTPEHQVATDTIEQVLFCDIAPKAGAGSWLVREKWPIVLDHHVGAKAVVESFGSLGVYADAEKEPGVSGAVLAYREVWMSIAQQTAKGWIPRELDDFAYCVGARDTWQTQDPRFLRGQWISKMLMSKPAAWWLDESGHGTTMHHAPYLSANEIEMGRALFEAHEEAVRQADERDRLRKLFADAGQGEHNVLALIDHYQREAIAAQAEVARLRLWLVAFAECAEAAERNAASDGTGMRVPFHQDFSYIKSNPALRRDLRWWANACREAAKETK